MKTLMVILNIFLWYLPSELVTTCKNLYTKQPLNGYHCETNQYTSVTLHPAQYPQCVWRCLSKTTCRYINHNIDTGQCELGFGQCVSLKMNVAFSFMVFGPLRHDCLHWGSDVEPGRVPIQVLNNYYNYVARIVNPNYVLLGRLNSKNEQFWANSESILIGPIYKTDQDIEILTTDDACNLLWLAYTAGETLPNGAVADGRLSDGSPTYVAKITHRNRQAFGYYNPISELAYYEAYKEVHTATSMDILVLM